MNRIVFVVCDASFPQIRELEERFSVVSAPILILGTTGGQFLHDLWGIGKIIRNIPNVEAFALREFEKEMRALTERRWGGRTTFHQSKGNFAEDRRRKVPWRRNARNR